MPRLLCFGDIHLGAGTSLGRQPGDRLQDQADVLARIAGLAQQRSVDGILVAGDVFEGPGVTPEQQAVFADFITACRTADIPILAVTGNGRHDQAMRDTNGLAIFGRLDGITVSSRPEVIRFASCTVCTLPWVSPGRLLAQRNGDIDRDRVNDQATDMLIQIAADLRYQSISAEATPMILLGHWSVSGASLPTGLPVDQLREPVLPVEDLDALGYDHIVMGHIHRAQPIGERERGFYVGSPLPLNFGETGTEHGCFILDTEAPWDAHEFVSVESRPLVHINRDMGVSADIDGAIVKFSIRSTREEQRRLDFSEIRQELFDAGAHTVKIEVETIREDRSRIDTVTEDLDPLDAYDLWVAASSIEAGLAVRARDQMASDLLGEVAP